MRAAGGVCIADEVQTGFGRTGTKFWGFENQVHMPINDTCPVLLVFSVVGTISVFGLISISGIISIGGIISIFSSVVISGVTCPVNDTLLLNVCTCNSFQLVQFILMVTWLA